MNRTSRQRLIVTLDGPAGAGKSSVSLDLAHALGVDFLDTGAMYRGVAISALDAGLDIDDAPAVGALVRTLKVDFDFHKDPPQLRVNGSPIPDDRLRAKEMSSHASKVAVNSAVRQVLVEAQRQIGKDHPYLVTEGRDQGSFVFPDADVKFYLTARPEVRARRRVEQLRAKGQQAEESDILREIIERDKRDSGRHDAPLICPQGAITVDTSEIPQVEVVRQLVEHVARKTGRTVGQISKGKGGVLA